MENCPNCGLPVEDGAKFCANCGTRMQTQLINKVTCTVCGNTLKANAKFCNVCGTPVPQPEKQEEKEEEERNPTMDSIEVPELHFDDAPVQNQTIPQRTPDMPTMDSVYLPGQEPKQPEKHQPVQYTQPTAEEIAMASRTVNIQPTPVVQETPQVAQQPQQERVLTPEGYVQNVQNIQNVQNTPNMPNMQNPQAQNQYGQQMNGVTPGKGAGALVPVILVILIIAVICVDVFWLFRDQIFGKKDDKSSGCAVVTLLSDEESGTAADADGFIADLTE